MFDNHGRKLWSIDRCCPYGAIDTGGYLAENGYIWVCYDGGSGGACYESGLDGDGGDGEPLQIVKENCPHLRVIREDGRLLFSAQDGQEARIGDMSPDGHYLLIGSVAVLDARKAEMIAVPIPPDYSAPGHVSDDGVITFTGRNSGSAGHERWIFLIGEGLKKIKNEVRTLSSNGRYKIFWDFRNDQPMLLEWRERKENPRHIAMPSVPDARPTFVDDEGRVTYTSTKPVNYGETAAIFQEGLGLKPAPSTTLQP